MLSQCIVSSPSRRQRAGRCHSYSWQHAGVLFLSGIRNLQNFQFIPTVTLLAPVGSRPDWIAMHCNDTPRDASKSEALFALSARSPYKYVISLWMELIFYRIEATTDWHHRYLIWCSSKKAQQQADTERGPVWVRRWAINNRRSIKYREQSERISSFALLCLLSAVRSKFFLYTDTSVCAVGTSGGCSGV